MLNRNSSKDSLIGIGAGCRARNVHTNGIHNSPVAGLLSHRRVMSFTNTTTTTEDFSNNNVDLFSRNRRSLSVVSSDESDWQVRFERLVGSTKPEKNAADDLLSSNEGGNHDYDWLLTPPGTPQLPSSDGKESQPTSVPPRKNSLFRSVGSTKTSRLSVSQSETSHTLRSAARSSSVTHSSISTTQYSNRNSSILNTTSSYIRPSTPTSRASTPSRNRPSSTSASSIDKNIRPVNPTHRPQSPNVRPASRSSTPTRSRAPTPSNAPSPNGPRSRPSSPGSRIRQLPINLPDFPHETPPNLRTSLPDRPLSAGRSRPGAPLTVKGHVENTNIASMTKRQSSPVVTRGRLTGPNANANGHVVESLTRNPIKTLTSESDTGFGRSISRKSLDMAIKPMDIRNEGVRPLSGSTLFPQSIRCGNPRNMQPGYPKNAGNGFNSKHGRSYNSNGYSVNTVKPYSSKPTQIDIYESLKYDSILLKEDLKNTSWLHSADENSDQTSFFDNGFEPPPEPFGPL